MTMHYIIHAVFVFVGLLSMLASIFNWDWFFKSHNTEFVVKNVGRKRARWFYAAIGLIMISTGIFFFLKVSGIAE